MAIAFTIVAQGANFRIWDVTCLDADTTNTVAHGLPSIPKELHFTPSTAVIAAAIAAAVTADATNVTLNKANAGGSGGTTPGTTVVGKLFARYTPSVT